MSAPATSGLVTVSNGAEAGAVSAVFDPGFYQRVAFLTTMVAYAVLREGTAVDGHLNRASRALQWLENCDQAAAQIRMAMSVTRDLSITPASTSQQIADQVAALWDSLSGN